MKNPLILFVLLCTLNLPANATNVSGAIYNNTNWTLANSPYVVTGDLVIFHDAVLTIDAGVQVLVDSMVKIEIKGKLRVNGTALSEVVIKGNTSTNNWKFWPGISFTGSPSTSGDTLQADIMYCRISNATYALDLANALRPPYKFRHCTFTHNRNASGEPSSKGGALFDHCTFKYSSTALYNPGAAITNCVFDSNEIGLYYTQEVKNCKFTNHSRYAIRQVNVIIGCEITDNNIGIEAKLNFTIDACADNIIMNNDTGIVIYSCNSGHTFINNKICSNNYNVVNTQVSACDLPDNCWCTMDSTLVRGKVHDGYIDMTLGLVDYMPMKAACYPTGIPGTSPENEITVDVYPNPNNGTFTLQLANANFKNASVQVYDMIGRECYKSSITNSKSRITLSQPRGIYLVKLQLDETILTKRVIVE